MHNEISLQNTIVGIFNEFWLCKRDRHVIRYEFDQVQLDRKFVNDHILWHVELQSSLNFIMILKKNSNAFKQ